MKERSASRTLFLFALRLRSRRQCRRGSSVPAALRGARQACLRRDWLSPAASRCLAMGPIDATQIKGQRPQAHGENSMPDLIENIEDGVATLTFNRPERMNALSKPIMDGLLEGLPRLAGDPSVAVIVLTGAGRAFCAGGDVKRMAADGKPASEAEARANPRAPVEGSR